ncbi:MAG: glycosyltransferase [Erysipelotrichaceae bacterium]|nr:glycosyltransferase [Erysipelotrichaceae bacterium]
MSCLSVIVPCYNGEKFIGRCLESLVNQTLQDIEIIVINDGSTDNSQDIIDSYANKYHNIKAYKIPNSGIADARNFGVSKVETPYFGFLDCDDYTDVTMFEKMYNKAIETNAQVVVSNFYWVKGKKKKLEKEGPYNTGKDMLIHLFAVLWNKIYDTAFVRSTNIRFPSGNRYEDAYFLYCLAPNIERLAFVDEAFVHYVQHENSITHNNNEEVKNMITIFDNILNYYAHTNRYDEYHDELEYLHIKFFLGNSFLRSARIDDKQDRDYTIQLGWNMLNDEFPDWHHNHYLKELPGLKNLYFRMVYDWNVMLFAYLFRIIG